MNSNDLNTIDQFTHRSLFSFEFLESYMLLITLCIISVFFGLILYQLHKMQSKTAFSVPITYSFLIGMSIRNILAFSTISENKILKNTTNGEWIRFCAKAFMFLGFILAFVPPFESFLCQLYIVSFYEVIFLLSSFEKNTFTNNNLLILGINFIHTSFNLLKLIIRVTIVFLIDHFIISCSIIKVDQLLIEPSNYFLATTVCGGIAVQISVWIMFLSGLLQTYINETLSNTLISSEH